MYVCMYSPVIKEWNPFLVIKFGTPNERISQKLSHFPKYESFLDFCLVYIPIILETLN